MCSSDLKWVKEFGADPQHAFPGHGQMKPEQLEIERLRREVQKLKAERDILKKKPRSMGAVMVTAALKAASPASDKPPCVNAPVDQWWGIEVNNWRDCFEALTSGDFLTAGFLGLAFNDMLPFAFRDRAAIEDQLGRASCRERV